MKLLLLYSLIIILKAIADGLNDTGYKDYGHALTALWIAGLLVIPFICKFVKRWYEYLIGYVLLNIALFDFAYNITRGLQLSYVGTTSWWDQAISTVPFGFMLFVRLIALIVGIFLILNNAR